MTRSHSLLLAQHDLSYPIQLPPVHLPAIQHSALYLRRGLFASQQVFAEARKRLQLRALLGFLRGLPGGLCISLVYFSTLLEVELNCHPQSGKAGQQGYLCCVSPLAEPCLLAWNSSLPALFIHAKQQAFLRHNLVLLLVLPIWSVLTVVGCAGYVSDAVVVACKRELEDLGLMQGICASGLYQPNLPSTPAPEQSLQTSTDC